MTFKSFLAASVAFASLTPAAWAQSAPPSTAAAAPVSSLVSAVDIPYQQFTLKNGLRVVVHTDRKAPVVAVSVWYDVGSKHEPKGKTGFAHLFEHLMFNGSENAPGDFFEPLQQVGATDFNGTTYFDRTNYFETVPRAALDRALFLESDRMGYLTGAITQGVLDEQRGVVQNEKRQGDNQPYGLLEYKLTEGLFPASHPYGHTTIGSMADLDAATLTTVKDWFRDHYGPNNAVLVLAGDIDVATARPLVEKYFGAIPAGPKSVAPPAAVPASLPGPSSAVIKDNVPATMIVRTWAVPGLNDPAAAPLDVAAGVLGGLQSSRLDNELVKRDKLAVQVSADNSSFAQVGTFTINAIVRPGVDPAVVSRRIDEIMAEFLKNGPTADEVNRYVTQTVSRRISGLESVGGFGGKAVALAEGALYSNDPGYYKKQLARLAAQTPASVKAAADQWLSRPSFSVQVVPGKRDAYEEAKVPPAVAVQAAPEPAAKGTRGPLPTVGQIAGLSFPKVEHARLSNGVEIVYAQRATVPMTQAVLSFDAGAAADVADKLGTQALTLAMIDEGTRTLNSVQLAEAKERLGATIGTNSSADRTTLSLQVPSANLGAASQIWADVARAPAFPESEFGRVKTQQLTQIQLELTSPNGLAQRMLPRLISPNSPYAKAQGSGDPRAVQALTRADLVAFQQAWLRPDKAKIFVVSDRPLGEIRQLMEQRFGDWRATGTAGQKAFPPAGAATRPRIVLIDRPDSPQSLIVAGAQTGLKGTDDLLPYEVGNDALGGSFLGRINMDLRETKHWSYGAGGNFRRYEMAAPYAVQAPVQANQTGPSIAAMRGDIAGYVGAQPMTQAEFERAINGATRSLSGDFETSGDVLRAMQANDLYKRPDDYYATITQKYRALTLPQVNAATKAVIDPGKFVWLVVGDAKQVQPQLGTLGLPVEVMPAAAVAAPVATAAPATPAPAQR
ncbi:Predicted Zn-dependent peptidase [Sphingomonas palmae]|uniref:Predicted Zn-dependent peptidase n=1 Tax=Sphingomonas palmae TaxID=1855283 RepID=A0A1H7RBC7_9SPHN|nr:pitrilysin family protein [Sphingomonas palmae]SEL57576.1 Predicted Zn-dependent peptidase [Sphingomonas palmae]